MTRLQKVTSLIKPEYKQKPIRSYVIRAGRMTDGQKTAFDKWWPKYGLSLFDGELDLKVSFDQEAPTIVEIGFGMGDSLLNMVKDHPNENFVGIEVHPPGVGRIINHAGLYELNNLRVYMADAIDVLNDCFADHSVDRLQLFFPDPWQKKKHNKRRIVQPEFVALVKQKLKANGVFHMATDWEDYAEHMMEVMCLAPGFENLAPEYHFSPAPAYRPKTKFETRGEKLGHGVWDILFRKI